METPSGAVGREGQVGSTRGLDVRHKASSLLQERHLRCRQAGCRVQGLFSKNAIADVRTLVEDV
jgi:hypothetical protein